MKKYQKIAAASFSTILLFSVGAYSTGFADEILQNTGFIEKKLTDEEVQQIIESVDQIDNEYGSFQRVDVLPALDEKHIVGSPKDVKADTEAINATYGIFVKQ